MMKKIQDIYKTLGDYGCLLLCYLNEANIDVDITRYFNNLVELGIINEDCFILDANRLLKYFGSELRVKRGFNTNGNTIVKFRTATSKEGHFVVINKNREIVFNSLENSNCVKNGFIDETSARYLA